MNGEPVFEKRQKNILKDGNNTTQIEDRLKMDKTGHVVLSGKKKHCKQH